MVIFREKRPQGTVDKPCDEDLVFGGTCLALEKATRETSCGRILFLIVNRKWEKIRVFFRFFV